MVDFLLHIIGLCPDSISHFDIMDFVVANYNAIITLMTRGIK